jgi:hypothetical protein
MTPFDMLFFAVIAALVLVIAVELWTLRVKHRPDDEQIDAWIQVYPPDD